MLALVFFILFFLIFATHEYFQHVRDSVELIEEKDSLGCVERKNTKLLKDFLVELLSAIDTVSEDHIQALQNPNLSDPVRYLWSFALVTGSKKNIVKRDFKFIDG